MLTQLYRKISNTSLHAKGRRLGRDAIQNQLEDARANIKVPSKTKNGKIPKKGTFRNRDKDYSRRQSKREIPKDSKPESLAQVNPPRMNPAFGLPVPGARPGAFSVGNGLIPAVPPGAVVGPNGALAHVFSVANDIGGKASTIAAAFEAANALDKSTNRVVSNKVREVIKNNRNKRKDGGGSGGPSKTINDTGNGGVSYSMMCDKPTSQKIDLTTGVRSGLIVNPGEPTNGDDFSDLYIMGGNLLKRDAIPTSFSDYIKNVIYPEVATRVQFNLNYSYEMTLLDFENWFYQLTKALELYYTLDSVIAFNDNRENTNSGCRAMRRRIDSQMRLQLNLLRDILGKQPIPPKVLHLVRYMYQHFKFSELPGSPIYRLVPANTFNDGAAQTNDSYFGRLSKDMIERVTKDLTSKSPVYNKIYQAIPEWHVPNSCMPPSCNEAYYDSGFRTFWFNAGLTYNAGAETIYTRSRGGTDSFRYWLYTNNFDGIFFAMSSFHKTGELGTRPGIWSPTVDFTEIANVNSKTNTLCYQPNGSFGVIGISSGTTFNRRACQFDNYAVPVWDNANSIFSEIYNQDGSSQVAQECTFETWKQAVYNTSAWMFD